MERTKNQKGITLIALVITIIVLLILAGVGVNMAISSEGLFAKANQAVTEYNEGVIKEEQAIADLLAEMEKIDSKENIPNRPKLVDGMTPVKYTLPEGDTLGQLVKTSAGDSDWYNYDEKYWANAQTQDGSLWVWIPRYAYRINSDTQTTEVVFLRGTSDNYYDEDGNIQTAKRCKTATDEVNTKEGFTVHPAFTNESNIGYRNGGWDSELTGIWVAKFEAGYAGGNNNAPEKDTDVVYTQEDVWVGAIETESGTTSEKITARNWYNRTSVQPKTTKFKYPTFQPLTYSLNYLNYEEAYLLAQAMNDSENIYGFRESTADTHLMKDSEWGMVAYLSQSEYGLDGTNISINNITLNSGGKKETENNPYATIYAVTGCTEGTADNKEKIVDESNIPTLLNGATKANEAVVDGVYVWNQIEGQKASTTGNIYGIYDLSGGLWEKTAGYVSNGRGIIETQEATKSTKYVKVYACDSAKDTSLTDIDDTKRNEASEANYNVAENTRVYGDAMHETSIKGEYANSWYNDSSSFPNLAEPFLMHGHRWAATSGAGLFGFTRSDYTSSYNVGFRAVMVAK